MNLLLARGVQGQLQIHLHNTESLCVGVCMDRNGHVMLSMPVGGDVGYVYSMPKCWTANGFMVSD